MPPRYVYWTILIDGKATAFRAREKEELLPTFNQLRRTNKDVVMKWFARGRLWETPEEASAALRAKVVPERRGLPNGVPVERTRIRGTVSRRGRSVVTNAPPPAAARFQTEDTRLWTQPSGAWQGSRLAIQAVGRDLHTSHRAPDFHQPSGSRLHINRPVSPADAQGFRPAYKKRPYAPSAKSTGAAQGFEGARHQKTSLQAVRQARRRNASI